MLGLQVGVCYDCDRDPSILNKGKKSGLSKKCFGIQVNGASPESYKSISRLAPRNFETSSRIVTFMMVTLQI